MGNSFKLFKENTRPTTKHPSEHGGMKQPIVPTIDLKGKLIGMKNREESILNLFFYIQKYNKKNKKKIRLIILEKNELTPQEWRYFEKYLNIFDPYIYFRIDSKTKNKKVEKFKNQPTQKQYLDFWKKDVERIFFFLLILKKNEKTLKIFIPKFVLKIILEHLDFNFISNFNRFLIKNPPQLEQV